MKKILYGKLNIELAVACIGSIILAVGGIRPYLQVAFFVTVYVIMCIVIFLIDRKHSKIKTAL